jgi:hypothetical protein
VRNYVIAEVRDAASWDLIRTDVLPSQQQGETIAIEPPGRSYLIGTEGFDSALVRIAFDPDADTAGPTTTTTAATPTTPETEDPGGGMTVPVVAVVTIVLGLAIAAALVVLRGTRPT